MQIFTAPFRIFFFLTALIAVFIPMYFVGILNNDYYFVDNFFSAFTWHGHEMIFGYPIALMTGFILTASANWTGKITATKKALIFMSFIWVLARLIAFFQPSIILLFIFLPLPSIILLMKLISILKGHKNLLPISAVLTIFTGAHFLNLYANLNENLDLRELSYKLVTYVIFTLVFIFSGRLIPFFTNSFFKKNLITIQNREERITWVLYTTYFLFYFSSIDQGILIFAVVSLIAFSRRAYNFFTKESLKEPMVIILNIAHSFFLLYFAIRIFNILVPDLDLGRSGLHTFFTGVLSLFAISIMTRASLGHSGKKLKADLLIKLSFVFITVGSLLRIFLPIIRQELFDFTLHISMGIWTMGFIFFLIKFTPLFIRARENSSS